MKIGVPDFAYPGGGGGRGWWGGGVNFLFIIFKIE